MPGLRRATMRAMRVQRFGAHVAAGPRGSAIIAVPFDPDGAWGAKAEHPVGGTINGRQVRGTVAPEGPQRGDLAGDLAAALEANPAAAAFFDTLAQFYRKAYLCYICATTRRPDLRAARIAEVVGLLAAGIKQRP